MVREGALGHRFGTEPAQGREELLRPADPGEGDQRRAGREG